MDDLINSANEATLSENKNKNKNKNENENKNIEHARNAKALFVFAHGAGANKDHVFMKEVTQLLLVRNISVLRFNFPYMIKSAEDGIRRPPDRMSQLLQHFQKTIENISTKLPLFIGGKSMGGRVAATLLSTPAISTPIVSTAISSKNADTSNIAKVKAGICIGYPFHPAKKTDSLRLSPLQNTLKPILICQGDRDTLGNKAEIATYDLSDRCNIVFFADGDHDLKPRIKSGENYQQHKITMANTIKAFIDENC